MRGHIDVESNDAMVLYLPLCFAMHHVDLIDVILSCMIP